MDMALSSGEMLCPKDWKAGYEPDQKSAFGASSLEGKMDLRCHIKKAIKD